MTRLFGALGCILGVLAICASLLLRSWLPLAAAGIVMLCVMGITLSEAAIFAPLLALILHAGEREKKTKAKPARPDPAPRDSTPPS
jgi:hypothetical protein